ncbi:MAG: hypothetical protein GKR89_14155 [Candidatus Latescibacteria bacterium]|nr:hypothetical protein [Candidatus Latescibacterota bacterium]
MPNHPSHSFTDLLDRFGQEQPPFMTYRPGEDIAVWQQRFRRQLEQLRSPLPQRPTPQVEILDSIETADHFRQRLQITVGPYSTLPANLLIPQPLQSDAQRPSVLVLHGHESDIDAICGHCDLDDQDNQRRAYGLAAVRAGYVVLAPSLWGWEGRQGHLDRIGRRDKCNTIQMAASMYGINLVDLHLQDLQAALDVLSARPEVAPDRIGCLGNSTGGRMAMWLSIVDQRIKACISSGSMNTFRERSLKLASCAIQYPFGLLRYGDVPELYSLLAPLPLQLQAGEQDPLINPVDREALYETVRRAYRAMGADENLDYVLHAKGHILQWEQAEEFLRRYLQRSS